MKKKLSLLFVFIGFVSLTYAQKGDFYIGVRDGFITNYNGVLFGAETGYHLTNPLEISFSFLMNPRIKLEDKSDPKNTSNVRIYAFDLNLHYYAVMFRNWATGPVLGGGYEILKKDYYRLADPYIVDESHAVLNVGWRVRYSVTNNIKLNGGWQYAAAKNDMSHHIFYLGIGYTFTNLF